MARLTDKQLRFVEAYLVNRDPKESARIAGYPNKSCPSIGCQNLNNPKILQELTKRRAELVKDKHYSRTLNKEDFVDKAMECFEVLDVEQPNKPRFLEIAGKANGILQNHEQSSSQTLNLTQININGSESQAELWELTRKLIGNE